MDVCKVMTDTQHFVMNHSTALISGIFVPKSDIGSIGRRRAVCLQTRYSAPAVNQPTKCTFFLRLLIKIITCLVVSKEV